MAQFVKVGTREDFTLDGGRLAEAGGQEIAVFNLGGAYYAIENTCTHRGGPLAEGMVEDDVVTCPWHALATPSRQAPSSARLHRRV